MTVYVDVLIFTNMFENLLLLLCVKRILRLNTKYLRILVGSFSGGLISLAALLPQKIFILNIAVKVLSTVLLVLISFDFKEKRLFIKTSLTLLAVTFLFSGAMICFYLTIKPSGMTIINDIVYFDISPVLLIILTLLIYIILFIFRKLFSNHSADNLIHNVCISYLDKKYEIKCKADSGCNLKEPFSGESVIVIEKSILGGLKPKNIRAVPFDSLGGDGIIYAFKADSIIIDNENTNESVYIGMTEGLFNSEIKGIIPINLLKG